MNLYDLIINIITDIICGRNFKVPLHFYVFEKNEFKFHFKNGSKHYYTLQTVQMQSIMQGRLITKQVRHQMFEKVAGGAGSRKPEIYQRAKIIEITGVPCPKTKMRINLRTNTMKVLAKPNTSEDGFDYSEDLDGVQTINGKLIYLNLKCVVGIGGSQTRSLREVYWFINGQINVLKPNENIYFANILDGDEADSAMNKFHYLTKNLSEELKNRIYIGDLVGYLNWFRNLKGETQ